MFLLKSNKLSIHVKSLCIRPWEGFFSPNRDPHSLNPGADPAIFYFEGEGDGKGGSRLWSRKHRYFSLQLGLNTLRIILRQVDFTYFTLGSITWYLVVARILESNKEICERGEGGGGIKTNQTLPLLICLCIGRLHVVTKGSVTASMIVTNQWDLKKSNLTSVNCWGTRGSQV